MRTFIGLVVAAGIIYVVVQKRGEQPNGERPAAKPVVASTAAASKAAPVAEPAANHWPKRALDRANDVKRQVAEQRKGDETR